MDKQDIKSRLIEDAELLSPVAAESTEILLSRLDEADRIEDPEERKRLLAEASAAFVSYSMKNDWISQLPEFDIDADEAALLLYPAFYYDMVMDRELVGNDYFTVCLRQLLRVFIYDDAHEKAFASEHLSALMDRFGQKVLDFFNTFASVANKYPGNLEKLPDCLDGADLNDYCNLELAATRSDFARNFPLYSIYDADEYDRCVAEYFGNAAPDRNLCRLIAKRLLIHVEYILSAK